MNRYSSVIKKPEHLLNKGMSVPRLDSAALYRRRGCLVYSRSLPVTYPGVSTGRFPVTLSRRVLLVVHVIGTVAIHVPYKRRHRHRHRHGYQRRHWQARQDAGRRNSGTDRSVDSGVHRTAGLAERLPGARRTAAPRTEQLLLELVMRRHVGVPVRRPSAALPVSPGPVSSHQFRPVQSRPAPSRPGPGPVPVPSWPQSGTGPVCPRPGTECVQSIPVSRLGVASCRPSAPRTSPLRVLSPPSQVIWAAPALSQTRCERDQKRRWQ